MIDEKILTIEAFSMKSWWSPAQPLRENLLAMFTKARKDGTPMGWAYQDEDRFKAVVGAVLLNVTDGPDHEWIRKQLRAMAAIAHMISGAQLGISADFGSLAEEMQQGEQRDYSLRSLWDDSKAAA